MYWRPASIPAPIAGGWPMWDFAIMSESSPVGPETLLPVTDSPPVAETAQASQIAIGLPVQPKAAVSRDGSFLKPDNVAALGAGLYLSGAGVLLARLLGGVLIGQEG
jgi:hypothetical protein